MACNIYIQDNIGLYIYRAIIKLVGIICSVFARKWIKEGNNQFLYHRSVTEFPFPWDLIMNTAVIAQITLTVH
jgi:hypothetical protein